MKTKALLPVFTLLCLLVCSCGNKSEKTEALPAHNVAEQVKEDWSKVEKPLEIIVVGREKEELEAIGSIAVWFEGIGDNKAVEFQYDGLSFKPVTAFHTDSSVKPVVFYPFNSGIAISDTLTVQSPLSQYLTGNLSYIETKEDKIIATVELQDLTALLRFKFQSDELTDILESVKISGSCIKTSGKIIPIKGEIIDSDGNSGIAETITDCLLNNGRSLDFHLMPTEDGRDIGISIKVNGKDYQISTTIPPLRKGSITELRLKLMKGRLSVGSSWVDTKHPFLKPIELQTDSIKQGYWLQKDGIVSPGYNENSIALVIETDGKHGKAVALKDIPNPIHFIPFHCGKTFDTVDGNEKEGCFKGSYIIENEELIEFSPTVKYSDKCALGIATGTGLFQELLKSTSEESRKEFMEVLESPCGYLPSLRELIQLSSFLISKEGNLPDQFIIPEGFYMTVCESGKDTFYSINPITCRISAYNSKKYSNAKQRLFYLF